MPGTGAELAQHLIERFKLNGVKVVKAGKSQNYYSPAEQLVALSPDVYDGKSVTAVATAAHEVGHAIQFYNKEPVTHLREKYMAQVFRLRKIGSWVMMSIPIITIIVKSPAVFLALIAISIVTMLLSVLMYVAILPEEFDASFKKAMPILKEGYLPAAMLEAANSVLKACAFTYLAAALVDVLNLWRWIRFLR
jgi:Zn-dependent membrane protease YugP